MKTILLADDEAHVRQVMSFKLRGDGYNVLTASDGLDAVEQARQSSPDLIVTDMQMPRLNGLQLAQQLASEPRTATIPIIMVTSREFEIGQDEIKGTNIKTVMSKPFSPFQLVNAVNKILQV